MTLDAATPPKAYNSLHYLFEGKKTNVRGTAFVVSTGVVLTAAHVVCGCDAGDLQEERL